MNENEKHFDGWEGGVILALFNLCILDSKDKKRQKMEKRWNGEMLDY
jgi:hypothetical protein